MNDKQMLELAAKAAGYKVKGLASRHIAQGVSEHALLIENDRGGDSVFDSLTDDGDALRLACDLGLRVYPIARTSTGKACSAVGSVTCERLSEVSDIALDTRTATRRAITRAAAEIGRAL